MYLASPNTIIYWTIKYFIKGNILFTAAFLNITVSVAVEEIVSLKFNI